MPHKPARAKLKRIVGNTYPVVGEAEARLTFHNQICDAHGDLYTSSKRDARLDISIERDGERVAYARFSVAEIVAHFLDPERAPVTDPADDEAFIAELRGEVT